MRRISGYALTACSLVAGLSGCATEMVVYKDVPAWQLREGVIPERYTRDDGVLVIHRPRTFDVAIPGGIEGKFESGEGEVRYRAVIPNQALSHMQECTYNADWKTMWEQVVSKRIRSEYEKGGGFEEFAAYMDRNRDDMYGMLSRMITSFYGPEVVTTVLPGLGYRIKFHWTIARDFKFAAVDLVREDGLLKVDMIYPYTE